MPILDVISIRQVYGLSMLIVIFFNEHSLNVAKWSLWKLAFVQNNINFLTLEKTKFFKHPTKVT